MNNKTITTEVTIWRREWTVGEENERTKRGSINSPGSSPPPLGQCNVNQAWSVCPNVQGTFVYFMINALWLVATLALQFVGADLYIQIPSTKNEGTVIDVLPLAFMFLITFSSMLIVQFLAMLYHRLFTLLHVLSYVESSSSGQQSKRGAVGRDNKAFVNDGDDDDAQQRRLREIV
uniref:Chitin synthase-like isoform X1 n=1 Tax=Petromyzon marinus TaxID=7757 RepID=A0AAJ7TAJ4_PETMA|nr:chitin synthase-like isoform X1 [Petromyzon marinus]